MTINVLNILLSKVQGRCIIKSFKHHYGYTTFTLRLKKKKKKKFTYSCFLPLVLGYHQVQRDMHNSSSAGISGKHGSMGNGLKKKKKKGRNLLETLS